MHYDYIIVGQGISGTLLSRCLQQQGQAVLVIDSSGPATASRVASGVINPVTGKRLVRTWLIEELMPFALHAYNTIEQELNIKLVTTCSILDMHATQTAQLTFADKLPAEPQYLAESSNEALDDYFRFSYGVGAISPCLLIAINTLLATWRSKLINDNALLAETFDLDHCAISTDGITYKQYTAGNIIFCDGAACAGNPYFNRLPWSKDKGEALIVSIPGLPVGNIYKQGLSIVPWQDGLFWVGATHDWKFTDMLPTTAYRSQVIAQLNYWLKLPYTIVGHLVAQRPVNVDRHPFVGMHPVHSRVGIFNGMGTKGCSLAPYFAHQLAQHLVHGASLVPEVNVNRFSRILSR